MTGEHLEPETNSHTLKEPSGKQNPATATQTTGANDSLINNVQAWQDRLSMATAHTKVRLSKQMSVCKPTRMENEQDGCAQNTCSSIMR
jgi:hypothetical protein